MNNFEMIISWLSLYLSPKRRKHILHIFEDYEADLSCLKKQYITFSDRKVFTKKWGRIIEEIKTVLVPKSINSLKPIRTFQRNDKGLDLTFDVFNKEFIQRESQRCELLFSNIDGKSLDMQQRSIVICDENRNLVLAGAGSGKTLTIAGKVKYLCSEKGISPKDILLVSFTNKAADEMTYRISEILKIPVQATTFHKLGLDIFTNALGKKPDIDDDLRKFINSYFENYIVNDPLIIEQIIKYFAYYINIPANMRKCRSLEEAYEYEKSFDLETLKSKYDYFRYIKSKTNERGNDVRTLKNEKVKSLAEVMISNFLFLNGVRYEYERVYPFSTSDQEHRVYKPDFYLPDYDIYIEHFGINRNGKLLWLSSKGEELYKEGMEWKRAIHKKNHTKLLETYSYYCTEGCLLEKLSELLIKNGIKFCKPDYVDIFNTIYENRSEKYFSQFINLCSEFIILYKSNGYSNNDLDKLHINNAYYNNPFFNQRTHIFKSIIKPIIEYYDKYLKEKGAIDFIDMINNATHIVNSGYVVHPYKWIIVDEYQDISVDRYKLLKAILDQTGAKLLCVGDDWQSIYRFNGSNISLFIEFEKYFGRTEIMKIERTYRNSNELINVAGHFIMRNPEQIQKRLHSSKHIESPIVFFLYSKYEVLVLKNIIDRIIQSDGSRSSILLLGRTKYDAEMIEKSKIFSMKYDGNITYIESQNTPITFMTVHKSKGLEADNVVLLNFQNHLMGFPNKKNDDPILNLVLCMDEDYPYAEERRLLYVALTRTKNRIYVMVNSKAPSEFFYEFREYNAVTYKNEEDLEFCSKRYAKETTKEGNVRKEIIPITLEVIEKLKSKFIAIDCETTGFDVKKDRIVGIGAVIYENGRAKREYGTIVNSGVNISPKVSMINHITNEMIEKAPNERDVIGEFVKFMGEANNAEYYLCAHNANFDARFIADALRRNGYDANLKFIDTLSIARKTIYGLKNYKLSTIGQYFGIKNNKAHDALDDAKICGSIMLHLCDYAKNNTIF